MGAPGSAQRFLASRSIARLAAPFGIAGGVHGYADKDERDNNHQRSNNDLHGHSSLND
jgi:hypothetical protein